MEPRDITVDLRDDVLWSSDRQAPVFNPTKHWDNTFASGDSSILDYLRSFKANINIVTDGYKFYVSNVKEFQDGEEYIEVFITNEKAPATRKPYQAGSHWLNSMLSGDTIIVRLRRDELQKIRHNFCCFTAFGSLTGDVRPTDIFPSFSGTQAGRTPDFILNTFGKSNMICIMDVTTTDQTIRKINNAFKSKMTYKILASEFDNEIRQGRPAEAYALIVTSSEVHANGPVSQGMVNELIISYNVAEQLEDFLLTEGFSIPKDTDYTERQSEMNSVVSSIQSKCVSYMMDYESFPDISMDVINKFWSMSEDPEYTKRAVEKYLADSITELEEMRAKPVDEMIEERFLKYAEDRKAIVKVTGEMNLGDKKKSIGVLPVFKLKEIVRNQMPKVDSKKAYGSFTKPLERFFLSYAELLNDDNYLTKWWKGAFLSAANTHINGFFEKEEPNHKPVETNAWQKKFNSDRNKRNRVNVALSKGDKHQLAKDGVNGKEFANEPFMRDRKTLKKRLINAEEDVTDITECIEGGFFDFLMKEGDDLWDQSTCLSYKSLDKILSEHLGSNELKMTDAFITSLRKTQFGDYTYIMHRIVEELNFSLSQSCTRNKFILKQVDDLPVFLLIKPTRVDSHIFFSIMIDKTRCSYENYGLPFRSAAYEDEKVAIFDPVSLHRHKISHYYGMFWRMIPFLSNWMDLLSIPQTDVSFLSEKENYSIYKELICTTTFSWLVFMDATGKVSTDLQQLRYAYMDACSVSVIPKDPLKCLEKFSKVVRNRLQFWVHERAKVVFSEMMKVRPIPAGITMSGESPEETKETDELREEEGEESIEKDYKAESPDALSQEETIFERDLLNKANTSLKYRNLLSFTSLNDVSSFEYVLNLSYIGYIHNKDEVVNQANFQILRKILSEEIKLRNNTSEDLDDIWSDKIRDKYENHLYSAKMTVNVSAAIARHLSRKLGAQWKKKIRREMFDSVGRRTLEDYATLKASAVRPQNPKVEKGNDLSDLEERVQNSSGSRRKCLEAILEVSKDLSLNVNPFKSMSKLMTVAIKEGGTYAALFKKNQIGGEREIFILTIIDRLLINFLETISRVVCGYLDCEMMTKPSVKATKSTRHFSAIAESLKSKSQDVVTAIDSGDCTTWAQRFVMEVFLGMYKEIVDFDLFVVIGAILKLHANKRLELPAELAYYFLKNPDIPSTDKGMEELKAQFAGQSKDNDLVEPLSRLLKNRSNMEQGILHFTSSMLHAGFKCLMQEVNDKLVDQFLSKIFTKEGSFRFVRDDKVSSDDMSTIRTIAIDWSFYSKKEIKEISSVMSKRMSAEIPNLRDKIKSMCAIYTAILTLLESKMMNMLTIKESNEKSTRNVLNKIEEFNSVWLVMDTVMCPKVKFLYPATFTSPISNFYNRTSTAFDQRKQMVENGCSLLTASITGECQRALHYMSLGSTSRQDKHLEVLRSLEEKPCISNGYFPQEPERMCGLLGLDFIHYLLCSRVEKYSKVESQNFSKDDIELNEHGLSTVKTFLLLGQARKYYETLDRILENNSLETAKLTLESNPICYFRQSEDAKESRAKIIMKIIQPSCVDAFSYLGPNKLYASAAYSLTQPVVSRRFYNDDGTVNRTKQSLIGILRDQATGEPLTEEQLSVLFPNRSFYEDVLVMYTGEINTMIPTLGASRLFNKYITIELPKSIARAPLSLSYCCRRIWFKDVFPKKYPDSLLRESWSVYQSIFNWLKDDLAETLSSSTFSTYRSLYQFISSMEPSSRSFKALTRGNREEGILATLKSIIRMSFIHFGRLSKGDDPVVFRSLESNMTKLKKEITKLVDTPLTWSTKMLLTKRIILDSADSLSLIDLVTNSTIFHTPRGIQDICIIALYLQWREGTSPKVYYTQNNVSQKLPFGNWYSKMRGAPKAVFLVRQTLDNQTLKWKGEGLISLTIDNYVYEVKVIDSKVLKVSCESIIKFESDKLIITDILRDLSLEPAQAIMNGAKIYCTMQGDISSSKIGSFAVMEVKGMNEKQPVSYYNSQYFIEYSEDSIKLMQQVPRSNNQRESMNPAFTVARVRFDQLKVRREIQWDDTDRIVNFNDPSSTSNLRDYLIAKYASDYESFAHSILHTERLEGRKLSGLIRDMEALSNCNVDAEIKNELSNMAINLSRVVSEDKFSRFAESSWQYEIGQILRAEGEESIIAMVHGLLDEIASESIRMRKKMREWFISRVMVKDYNKRYFTITSANSLKLRSMLMKEKIFDNKSASSISSIASSFRGDDVTTETVVKPAVEKAGLFDLEFDFDFIESQLSDLSIDKQQSNLESMAFNFDDVLVTQALSIIFDMEDKKVFEEKERISLTGLKSHLPWCDNFIEALLSSTHYKTFEVLMNEFLWNSSPMPDQLKDLVKELTDETHSEAIINGLIKTLYKLTMADTREMKFSKIVDSIIADKRREKEVRKSLLSEFSE